MCANRVVRGNGWEVRAEIDTWRRFFEVARVMFERRRPLNLAKLMNKGAKTQKMTPSHLVCGLGGD